MGRSSRSTSRDRYHSRKSSRSKRDDDRERRHKSSRRKERSKKRSHSRSPLPSTSTLGGSISALKEVNDYSVSIDIVKELTSDQFDLSLLSKAAMNWLEEKITEQVSARVRGFEDLVRERISKSKIDMESRLRAQIEQELKDEIEAMQKRENESKERCLAMEKAIEKKLKQVEESESKLNEERLQMLEIKSKLEMERASLQKEKELLNKTEQLSILNKGGVMREPIRLKLGK